MAKTAPINMRVEPAQQELLTKAAAILNIDRSSFILNVACNAAQDVLLDQRLFQLNEQAFVEFEAIVSEPVSQYKLKALFVDKSPWEE